MNVRLSVALLLSAAPVALAQTGQSTPPRDSATTLPGVTVTATREPAPILRTPIAITKITMPELRAVNGYGLEDALTLVPGVIAQSRYGTSDIRLMIRGFGARGAGDRSNSGTTRGVRILLDGFPETEPDGRTAFDQVDLAAAEAVEVVRSNASSVYGNAAGGVVNILTAPGTAARSLEFQPVFGGFGLRRYATRMSMPIGNGVGYATFTNTTFDGWRQHSDARRFMLNAGVVGSVGDRTNVGVYLAAANNLMHIPGPLTQEQMDADPTQAHSQYLSRDERRYNRLGRLGVSIEHDVDDRTSWSSMFYVNPKYLQRSERNTFRDFTRIHFGGNWIGRRDVALGNTNNRFSLGIDASAQDGAILFYNLAADTVGACPASCTVTVNGRRGPTLADNKGEGATNVGVFFQDDIKVNAKLAVLLGARYDRVAYNYRSFLANPPVRSDSKEFDRLSPKVGFSWMLGATHALYGNVGGGVEVPAGNETDPSPGPTAPPPALLNPLLEAINSTTYEVGFKSLGTMVGPLTLAYDVAAYDTEVQNDIIPYSQGRYYATAAKARRAGVELGANAQSARGVFGGAAITFSRNEYVNYVVDSAVINPALAGRTADRSGNEQIGIPGVMANAELGTEIPGYRNARLKFAVEHSGEYFADDANTITVPAFTIFNVTAELRKPIAAANDWGLRGFVTIHNLTDRKYAGSAFLNPDPAPAPASGPAVFEPGMPRTVIVSFSVGKLR